MPRKRDIPIGGHYLAQRPKKKPIAPAYSRTAGDEIPYMPVLPKAQRPPSHKIHQQPRGLTPGHLRAIDAVATRQPGESLESVAQRAHISKVSLWRYFNDARFVEALNNRVGRFIESEYSRVAAELVNGCLNRNGNQIHFIKLFLQVTGRLDLREYTKVTVGKDGASIEQGSVATAREDTVPFDLLSLETRKKILEEVKEIKAKRLEGGEGQDIEAEFEVKD